MPTKKDLAKRISREELEEATRQFLQKGGKIRQIDPAPKPRESMLSLSLDAEFGYSDDWNQPLKK